MPWQVKGVMEQRIEFVERALSEQESFSALCKEFGISRPTGYVWVRRYEEQGSVQALKDRSRRPKHSPHKTAYWLEQQVVELFREYGWGPKKTRKLLEKRGIELSLITVRRIYQRYHLSESPNTVKGPAPGRFERPYPNNLWQMDYKGQFLTDHQQWCFPLSILDDHSRFCPALFALGEQTLESTSKKIVKTFEEYGLPDEMLMDHGVPWWSNSNGWGLTKLSVQLIKQGIKLRFGRVRHPQTQGKVERFHRTLKQTLGRYRGKLSSLAACDRIFDEIKYTYNFIRPHEALAMEPPCTRYSPSKKKYNPNPPQWQYSQGALVAQVDRLGRITYDNYRYFICEALTGEYVQIIPLDLSALVVYRNMAIRELNPDSHASVSAVFPLDELTL